MSSTLLTELTIYSQERMDAFWEAYKEAILRDKPLDDVQNALMVTGIEEVQSAFPYDVTANFVAYGHAVQLCDKIVYDTEEKTYHVEFTKGDKTDGSADGSSD